VGGGEGWGWRRGRLRSKKRKKMEEEEREEGREKKKKESLFLSRMLVGLAVSLALSLPFSLFLQQLFSFSLLAFILKRLKPLSLTWAAAPARMAKSTAVRVNAMVEKSFASVFFFSFGFRRRRGFGKWMLQRLEQSSLPRFSPSEWSQCKSLCARGAVGQLSGGKRYRKEGAARASFFLFSGPSALPTLDDGDVLSLSRLFESTAPHARPSSDIPCCGLFLALSRSLLRSCAEL